MPDVNQRLDTIENTLTDMSQQFSRVNEQFAEVKQRLDTVDRRLDTVDRRLDTMDGRLDTLTRKVQNVHLLEEQNSTQIKLIAEVQTHHGRVLEQLVKDIEPLKVLPDLFKQVVQDHERRISAIEKSSGSTP